MWTMTTFRSARTAVLCGALVLGGGAAAVAQQHTYEGDVIAVDGKANTFTVKGSKPGEAVEMRFHVRPESQIYVDGERKLVGELSKGDHVDVTYGTSGKTHTVSRAERVRTAVRELTLMGNVTEIDIKGRTFKVKQAGPGEAAVMTFHMDRAGRLYLGSGEEVMWKELHDGDGVVVTYETVGSMHHVKHMMKKLG